METRIGIVSTLIAVAIMLAGAFVLLQVREKPVVPTPKVVIPPNSVGTGELKDGAVTLAKLASEVKAKLLAAGVVGTYELADGAVGGAKLATGGVQLARWLMGPLPQLSWPMVQSPALSSRQA